ncbi:LuxR C-terminal-related transcriptional regulator [Kitasatospora sp. NPDC001159]
MGRRHELHQVRQLLSRTRLLTLTGTGGIGKTRLALRVAHEVRRAFPGGVWVVDLAPLEDGGLLAQTVVAALGLDRDSSRAPLPTLADYLVSRRALLVLDNCEHILDSGAALTRSLLAVAPDLRVLATSRQALGVDGESLLPVPPLSLPDPHRWQPVESMVRYEAVQLFVDRATAVSGEFTLSEDHQAAVADICHRLDGIPLAIELAAAWLRVLSPQQILDRLDDRFALLTRAPRAALPRQQTLRAAIDWSFELCTPPERQLWAQASVFRGGFDLEAAEAVCTGEGVAREQVLTTLAALLDKSVLTRDDQHGRVRYRMLETIRHYGRTRLPDGRAQDIAQRRHRDHYQRLAARAEQDWFSPRQTEWFSRLRLDHANLRTAVEFCLTTSGEARTGLELVASLWSHRLGAGGLEEEREWLDRALALDTEPSAARAKALWVDGWLALMHADSTTAQAHLTECRTLAETLGDPRAQAHAVQFTGLTALFQDDFHNAAALLEDALQRHRATDDLGSQWTALFLLALAACLGRHPRALDLAEQCLALCVAHDARWSRPYALWILALQHWLDGDTRRTITCLQDALRVEEPDHNLLAVAQCLEVLAWATARDGAHQRAARLLGAAQTVWQLTGVAIPGLGQLLHHRDACEAGLRRLLGTKSFAAAVQAGAELSLDQAIACALGRVPPPPTPASPSASAPAHPSARFTRREEQVLTLLTGGLTDKQIAARLVISPRTAEGHVQRILTKLGFKSRLQIVAWAAAPTVEL